MKIKSFEEIEGWREARKPVTLIYEFTNKALFKKDFGLRDQIQQAAVSCMSNIAEGFESGTHQQFIQFLLYSRRSSAEVQSILYIALDRQYINTQEFKAAYQQTKFIGKLVNGFITYLKNAK